MQGNRRGRPRHPDVLTPAEWRVLDALREGGTNAEIAARLGISSNTVRYHVSNMLAKLELRDRRALAAWRPDTPRRRLGGVLAVPAALWSVGRPLVWVGVGAATLAAVVVVAVALVALEGIVEGDGDAPAVLEGIAEGDGDPGSRSTVAETELEVLSCESGVAVTNPETNTELVGDCESLLGLRDRIRGRGKLDWTAGSPMSRWVGVTVSGTPQRVTALDLSDLGLDGELSGLLGDLTGLTTLDLSGNPLTGMLPSKLALLANLATVSLAGTSFEGCAPEVLGDVATNDVTLDDCGEAPNIVTVALTSDRVLPAGTYYYSPSEADLSPVVFDIPEGLSISGELIAVVSPMYDPVPPPRTGHAALALEDPVKGWVTWIDLEYGGAEDRWYYGTMSGVEQEALDKLIDLLGESTWFRSPQ